MNSFFLILIKLDDNLNECRVSVSLLGPGKRISSPFSERAAAKKAPLKIGIASFFAFIELVPWPITMTKQGVCLFGSSTNAIKHGAEDGVDDFGYFLFCEWFVVVMNEAGGVDVNAWKSLVK
jgi:hypothetical protein